MESRAWRSSDAEEEQGDPENEEKDWILLAQLDGPVADWSLRMAQGGGQSVAKVLGMSASWINCCQLKEKKRKEK